MIPGETCSYNRAPFMPFIYLQVGLRHILPAIYGMICLGWFAKF